MPLKKDLRAKIARRGYRKVLETDATPFSSYASAWLERKTATLAPSTYGDYRSIWKKYVLPHLGNLPLCRVTLRDVDDFLGRLVLDNLKKNYAAGTAIRAMERGTRLYPISEYQWASYIKSIFREFKQAYDAKKDAQGRWKVCVPLYSTDTSVAENFLKGVMKVARMVSFGVPQANACFTFWNKTYPGGNVPIYVKGFASVDIVNFQYNPSCDTCSTYAPATDGNAMSVVWIA